MKPDLNTIPRINISEGIWGDVSIIRDGNSLQLFHSGEMWHGLNTKNQREIYEQWSSYDLAYGDVLLSGFGFGYTAVWVASKPEVKSVTVIEKSSDVISAYLSNNDIPSNVTVVIDDINTYQSNSKYDCVIFDHFNYLKEEEFYKKLCKLGKEIPHDLFWFWSIEVYHLVSNYGILPQEILTKDFSTFDFSTKWEELRSNLDMPTIPSLSKDKIDSYVNTYFLRHLLQ